MHLIGTARAALVEIRHYADFQRDLEGFIVWGTARALRLDAIE